MMETQVVSIRVADLRPTYNSLEEWLANPNHVYIGRKVHYVKGTFESIWANPFTVSKYGRENSIAAYENYMRVQRHDLMGRLEELEGKVLGCWCRPQVCHGDVLVKLIKERKKKIE